MVDRSVGVEVSSEVLEVEEESSAITLHLAAHLIGNGEFDLLWQSENLCIKIGSVSFDFRGKLHFHFFLKSNSIPHPSFFTDTEHVANRDFLANKSNLLLEVAVVLEPHTRVLSNREITDVLNLVQIC